MDATASARKSRTRPLTAVILVALVVLLLIVDMKRRAAEQQLKQLSIRLEQLNGNQAQNRDAAKQIVERVRKLYDIPADLEPTVATIVDVDALRQRNAFYNKAKNGDYLIVTTERAILYDAQKDIILDVVPVQIQEDAGQNSSAQ